MTVPRGLRAGESAVTVALLAPDRTVIKTRWLYCMTDRLRDGDFVQYVLQDSMRVSGFGQVPGLRAVMLAGLMEEREAGQALRELERSKAQ